MQSVNNVTETEELVPAVTLREMTITPEQIYNQQKTGILSQLMHSMVSVAEKNGAKLYQASLNGSFDRKMLGEILEKFNSLGYVTRSEEKIGQMSLPDVVVLTISWDESDLNASVKSSVLVQ